MADQGTQAREVHHANLGDHAEELLAPVQALLRVLSKIAARQADLSPQQRALLSTMTADVDALARRAAQLISPPQSPVEEPAAEENLAPKVLLVDDDLVWLEAARELMSREFRVLVASDGYEANELLLRERPEVIISDLSMPRSGGLALLEMVRAREETAETPVIVLSGTADTDTKVRAFELGATDYLTKPVPLAELIARTKNAIARAQALRRERLLQETDDLTGLANRRALRNILGSAIRYAAASRRPLTVAMVDQDRLKQINDRYGHAAGDEAIRAVARALMTCKRASDCAARYGGDEFCVVMPGTDRAGAERFVVRVQEELANHPVLVGPDRVEVSASFGLASISEVAWEETWDELIARADAALYQQKQVRRAERLASAAERFFASWEGNTDLPDDVRRAL